MIAVTILTDTGLIMPRLIAEEHLFEGLYSELKCSIIQIVPGFGEASHTYMLCDEDGISRGKVQNVLASALANQVILGHVAIVNHKDFQ